MYQKLLINILAQVYLIILNTKHVIHIYSNFSHALNFKKHLLLVTFSHGHRRKQVVSFRLSLTE